MIDVSRRFARVATNAVVVRPALWPVFRGPLRKQFDHLATTWEGRLGPEGLAPLEAGLQRVQRASRALDVGTGTGKAARLVAARFPDAQVIGVDLSKEMIAAAKRLLPPELESRVRFEVADASRLTAPDGAFDLVVLLNMIPFFDELARVTAAGGTLVLAYSFGPGTPIFVAPDALRRRLAPLGFGGFEEIAAGSGTAFVARKL